MSADVQPTTPEQIEEERRNTIGKVAEYLILALQMAGVHSLIIGISVDDSPEGLGYTKIIGAAPVALNLLAALIKRLRPEDFHALLLQMRHGDYFAELRGDTIKPTGKVN
jgi:hypothetical protein